MRNLNDPGRRTLITIIIVNAIFLVILGWYLVSQANKDQTTVDSGAETTLTATTGMSDDDKAKGPKQPDQTSSNKDGDILEEVPKGSQANTDQDTSSATKVSDLPLLLNPKDTTFPYGEVVNSVPEKGKKIAFTFDAAWEFANTRPLLEVLASFDVPATFFISGMWADKHSDLMTLIHAGGHEVVNHGYSHRDLNTLSREEIVDEVTRTAAVLERHVPYHSNLFRLPYGEGTPDVLNTLKELEYFVVGWSADSADWMEGLSAEAIIERVKKNTSHGGIVLFHVGGYQTLNVLPDLIEWYWGQGYEFVTVSELLRNK